MSTTVGMVPIVATSGSPAPLTPVDPSANSTTANLLTLLVSMPNQKSKVLSGQQYGAEAGPDYYQNEILDIYQGFTESDAGGTTVVPATNKYPALINFDLSFLLQANAPTYATQNPNVALRSSYVAGIVNGYAQSGDSPGNVASIDGSIANWNAGSLVSLTYHFDNPLTGGIYNDLSAQDGMSASTATVTTATTVAAIASGGSLTLSSTFSSPDGSGGGMLSVATSPVAVTATAVNNGTQQLTFASVTNIAVGQTVTGAGITGTAWVSTVNTSSGVATITNWNSPSVTHGSIGTLTTSSYTFTGFANIQFTAAPSGNTYSSLRVISGAGTIASGASVTGAGNGTMTSSFFSDPTSQAYSNFQTMLGYVITFCSDMQTAGASVLYRLFHEPNGNWFWWCQGGSGNPGTAAPWLPAAYAFVQQQLYNANVHNVLYVWGPIRSDGSATPWPDADMTSYPGDNVVDIAGVDEYGEDPSVGTPWQDSQEAIATARSWTTSTQKPFAIFEFGWINPVNYPSTYNSSTNPNGQWFKYDNTKIVTAITNSTPNSLRCGPAYFMSWGQNWAIRYQNNLSAFYGSSHVATQSDVVGYSWN
jgi:hypothetical protein